MIDLHTHTAASDGSMSAFELVRHAKDAGLEAIAITDHDGINSVKPAMEEGARIGLEVVPGIELSAQSDTECHIVGLYIDPDNKALREMLDMILAERRRRNLAYVERLASLGIPVTLEEAMAEAGSGLLARAHFAKAMVKKGYVASVKEAFDKWIGSGRPGYASQKQAISAKEAIDAINGAGGAAYAAHLHLMRKEDGELFEYLKELKGYGLAGVEGWYTEYTPEMEVKYRRMAADLGLGLSGGTDFHGSMKPHIAVGRGTGNLDIPYSVLEGIRRRLGM